jgi:hypothetical protein
MAANAISIAANGISTLANAISTAVNGISTAANGISTAANAISTAVNKKTSVEFDFAELVFTFSTAENARATTANSFQGDSGAGKAILKKKKFSAKKNFAAAPVKISVSVNKKSVVERFKKNAISREFDAKC